MKPYLTKKKIIESPKNNVDDGILIQVESLPELVDNTSSSKIIVEDDQISQ